MEGYETERSAAQIFLRFSRAAEQPGRERGEEVPPGTSRLFLLTSLPTQIECVHEQLIPPAFTLLCQCLNPTRLGRGRDGAMGTV